MEFKYQHSPANTHVPQVSRREVCIPTTTAIIHDRADSNFILVGQSPKHLLPVLPGGKIDLCDIVSPSMLACATTGMARELREELQLNARDLKLFEIGSDSERDVRLIQAANLRETIVEDTVRELADEELIIGRYGVPDYVFYCMVERHAVNATEELPKLSWININDVNPNTLSAGHGSLLIRYREARAALP